AGPGGGGRRARSRLHATGTLHRVSDEWQDLEFLRHVFDETRVVRKPLTGIIAGYHVLPYILVGPEHEPPSRSVAVRGRITASPPPPEAAPRNRRAGKARARTAGSPTRD